jgi:hypothetical protein
MVRTHKNKSGYLINDSTGQFVHREVAERKVGGPIYPGYEVHHKNGDKTDNRTCNVAVVRDSFHKFIHKKK